MPSNDKSQYLPLAQVQRMFKDMGPDGYQKYLEAYPGIDTDSSPYVKVDPDTRALMVAPPPAVQEQIRAEVIAKQSQMRTQQVQSAKMQPLGSSAGILTKEQMLAQARTAGSFSDE